MRKRLFLVMIGILIPLFSFAVEQGYAVFDSETGTLTFKYGEKPDGENVFDTDDTWGYPGWSFIIVENLKKVVFDASFSSARPVNTRGWFEYAEKLDQIIGVENLNTSEVIDMAQMFYGCKSLTKIDVSHFNTEKVKDMNGMFAECSGLTNIDVSNFDTSSLTKIGYSVYGECGMFEGCSSLEELDLSNFSISNVTSLGRLFAYCSGLKHLDLSNFNTSKVTNMSEMFEWCTSLESVNLSSFDTENVTDMSGMFSGCSNLQSIDLKNFNTSNVRQFAVFGNGLFTSCKSLKELDLSSLDTRKVESMAYMFEDCTNLTKLVLGENFKTDKVTNMAGMFSNCNSLTDLAVGNFNTSNVTDMQNMFYNCCSLNELAIEKFDTQNVEDMHGLFSGCSELTSLNINNFQTGKVKDMCGLFSGCKKLSSLSVSNFKTENVISMSAMFKECSNLTSLDLSSFDTEIVTEMRYMFDGCTNLKEINLNSFNTKNVTSMESMFDGCESLESLDLSRFNTNNVTNMGTMFYECHSLKSLNLKSFDTKEVTTMYRMFSDCYNLTELDLSNFDTSNVTDMCYMFDGCTNLKEINLNSFNTSKVTGMSWMFGTCEKLEKLDLSNFDMKNVIDIQFMFISCSNLRTIDLGDFNIVKVSDMVSLFNGCKELTTIYVSNKFQPNLSASGSGVFNWCEKLVGGLGTIYDSDHMDSEYARIDGGPEAPGYFTEKKTEGDIVTFTTNKGLTFEGNKSTEEAVLVSMDKFTEGEVIIPEAVVNEGTGYKVIALQKLAFSECAKIERITLAKSIKRIELPVFQGCSSLCAFEVVQPSDGNFVAVDGVLFSDLGTEEECMIVYPAAKGAEYEIPETVKRIGAGAFASAQLSSLTVRFSEPVDITTDVLEGLDLDNCVLNVPMGTTDKYRDHEVWGLFKNIVGESSIKVDDAVFKVTEDGSVVFSDIDKAKVKGDYIIPGTIIVDGNSVPVTEIAPHAFEGCEDLVSVSIPENIKKIGAGAFKGCKNLEEIFCFSPLPIDLSILSGTRFAFTRSGDVISQFEGIDFETCILYVPTGSAEYYRNADGWKEFKNIVEMGETAAITISGAKQVTYMSDKDLDFTGYPDLKAYVATGYDKASGTIWLTRVKEVPANTGFLLMGEADTYEIPVKAGGLSSYYQNMFKGTLEATTIYTTDGNYTNYYLSNGESGVGFYKVTKEEGITLGKNRAYLPIPTEIPAVGTAGSTEMIKVSSAGQVPYYNTESLDFSSLDARGVKAYTATGYDYNSGTIWLTRVKQVPAKTGILIMAPEGEYPVPTVSVSSVYANMFRGTLEGTTIQTHEEIDGKDYINYYLSSGASGVGFYRVTKEEGVKIGANRCYLPILNKDAAAGTRSANSDVNQIIFEEADEVIGIQLLRGIGDDENGTTSIKDLTPALSEGEGEWYTLQGQRVAKPGKGLYIRNGKMVIVR